MGKFAGGSAFAMCRQVAEGYLLVSERTFRRMQPPELGQLLLEVDKLLREIRATPQPGDTQELQQRNRRLQRLSNCRLMIQSHRQRRR